MGNVQTIRLLGSGSCTCCGACANICPKDAIRLVPDVRGFPVPQIDYSRCVTCRCCERVCPVRNEGLSNNNLRPRAFAVWHGNDEVRMASSSGGAFTLLAENVLGRGGLVIGAAWNQELIPELIVVEDVSGLGKLRESKYVQSNVGLIFRQVKGALAEGREVLFCAAPCQIAGLYAFLGKDNRGKLTTVDFICHAMPSPAVFQKYLSHLEEKLGSKVVDYHFRNKAIGVECDLLAVVILADGRKKRLYFKDNAYSHAFIHNLISKPSCASCRFNRIPRQADFSIADFRGLGEQVRFPCEVDKVKGFTGVLVNSLHAEAFIKDIDSQTWIERPLEELCRAQDHLSGPGLDSPQSPAFWEDFPRLTWPELVERYISISWKYRLYIYMRRVFGPWLFLRMGIVWKMVRGLRTTGWRPIMEGKK